MGKLIAPCGADCSGCEKYPAECVGCQVIQGRVWWTAYTGDVVCDFYNCCVIKNGLPHCGKCGDFPCGRFEHGDPTKSEAENKAIREAQIRALRQN